MNLREQIFLLAKEKLKTSNVLLELATGVGKTKLALDLATDYGAKFVTVLVPTDAVGLAWIEEMKKWNSNLTIRTVNYVSAHKVLGSIFPPDMVILDESHHVTERNVAFIKQYTCPMVALSATVDWEKMQLLTELGFERGITVDLDKATEHELVAEYEMHCITFKPNALNKTMLAGTKDAKWYTTEQDALNYAEKRIAKAKQTRNSNAIEFAYMNRMRMIRTLPSRIDLCKRLLAKLRAKYPQSKILIFAPDIAQAEAICPACFYHSKSNDEGFNAFKAGTQPVLASVNALSEGINVVADIAIIVAGLSKERHTVQRLGRLLRKTSEGKIGKAFLLVADGTQDIVWCENSLSGLSKVSYHKAEDLKL